MTPAIEVAGSTQNSSQTTSSKKRSNKKKKNAETGGTNGEAATVEDNLEVEVQQAEEPMNGTSVGSTNGQLDMSKRDLQLYIVHTRELRPDAVATVEDGTNDSPKQVSANSSHELEALQMERDSLGTEVEHLRKSLKEVQAKHGEELAAVNEQLKGAREDKENADSRYRDLLGRVSTIKSQLGERLRADAEELSQARNSIAELERQNQSLQASNETHQSELAKLRQEDEQRSKELSSLRNRMNLSQQNWSKEREDLITREALAREEFEAARQAMQDWEVLAMEERSIRESQGDRMTVLEEQLSNTKEAYEKAASERETNALSVDGLQRALQDIQDGQYGGISDFGLAADTIFLARKRELRELVETSHAQVESLRGQLQEVDKRASDAELALLVNQKELERALPFEKEVKEKNLLIGKLRHEAVILNDHLTKALRFLKKGNPEDNVDRQIVTNHFLHFLTLDRSDPKKFQVLQLIAALLNWTEEQREQAGLARPGASNTTLRTPISPFHRTPSTPALSADFYPDNNRESLAELWSNFLQQEAEGERKGSLKSDVGSRSRTGS
ncbi:hypothetical protein FGG08_002068 [Glutinoglossum americanum]|uniref:GRIP domain-containing protein n=1 Tax=Glutinoglossum americanum TaxID=1670608 RepID=A0A9P8L5V4_9PEZI|nr:hypothetical protein FGG08_002068 [Glutinoglossum americanum]